MLGYPGTGKSGRRFQSNWAASAGYVSPVRAGDREGVPTGLTGRPVQKPVDREPGKCSRQGISARRGGPGQRMDWGGGRVCATLTGRTPTQPRKDHPSIPAHLRGKPGATLGTVLSESDPEPIHGVPIHLWGHWGHDVERRQIEASPRSQTQLPKVLLLMPYYPGAGHPPQTSGKAHPAQTLALMTPRR